MRKKILINSLIGGFAMCSLAQEPEAVQPNVYISGWAGITSNGISLVPNFSLEQAAAIFYMNLEKGRFSFEPEVSFSLEEGRPWYQIYWLRYKIIDGAGFKLRTGTHLGLNFVRDPTTDTIETERYWVGEVAPSYELSENVNVGVYYMLARGFDIGTSDPLHFFTLNANIDNIRISKKLSLEVTPQLYYLSLYGGGEGYYATSTFKLSITNFPLSLSAIVNKELSTDITAGKDFLWNLTLTYNFKKAEIRL